MSKPIIINFPTGATPIGSVDIPAGSTDLNIDVLALINNGNPITFPFIQRVIGLESSVDLDTVTVNIVGFDVNQAPISISQPGPLSSKDYTAEEIHIITSFTLTGSSVGGGTLSILPGNVGQSQWLLFDLNRVSFNSTIQTAQTGTLTYTVEYTSDELTVESGYGYQIANPNINVVKQIQLTDTYDTYLVENDSFSGAWSITAPMRASRFVVVGGADAGSLKYIVTQTGI